MTILTVCEDLAVVVGIEVPTVVYGGTDRELLELKALANTMAKRIFEAHEWELFMTLATLTGDASKTAFDMPSDYDRFPKEMDMWASSLESPMQLIKSFNRWLDLDVRAYDFVVNAWIKIGGQINIKPAMATASTAKYYYISNLIVAPNAGSNKVAFTADDDTFRLDEELLKLGMIWQWRANKGRPYAEDMSNYEDKLSKLIVKDKGARKLIVGRRRMPKGGRTAYPQSINP